MHKPSNGGEIVRSAKIEFLTPNLELHVMSSNEHDPIHFMIDLETWDTTPSSVILSIGACVIGPNPVAEQTFYLELNPETQPGRTMSQDTMDWWAKQGNCPCYGSFGLHEALHHLRTFLTEGVGKPIVWCKGTDFDTAILAHAYKSFGEQTPWKYNDVRDFRTIKKMFGDSMITARENPNPHNALADAIYQAEELHILGLALK
jgi:hypothetical protein